MKTKALENLASSQLLIDQHHYTASVHCSYYAVLQYMKYMLANTSKKPVSYPSQSQPGSDSHDYLIGLIRDRINNPLNARNFVEGIRELKKQRVSADYELFEFSDIDSLDCRSKAEGLIMKLKTYFGNI